MSESDFFAECVYAIERTPDAINVNGYEFDALTDVALDVYNEYCIKFEIINIESDACESLLRALSLLNDNTIISELIKNDSFPFKEIELVYCFKNGMGNAVLLCVGKIAFQ